MIIDEILTNEFGFTLDYRASINHLIRDNYRCTINNTSISGIYNISLSTYGVESVKQVNIRVESDILDFLVLLMNYLGE